MNLKEKLIKENRNRWLDIGCGNNFEDGFYYLDILFKKNVKMHARNRYFEKDIININRKTFKELGKFDLIRMQHCFEHFSYEEGAKVLKNCYKLLNKGGIILISTPDLRIHIQTYLNDGYKNWKGFQWWAHKRIPSGAPNSFYFSIFAYSMLWESHKWCYDFEGLKYQLEKCGGYKNIKELKQNDELAVCPFTHNRPEEDVCIIATK